MDNKLDGNQRQIVATGNNAGNSASNSSNPLLKDAEHFALEAKHKWQDMEQALLVKGKEARNISRDYINQSPFKSVLAASAAGLLIGYIFSKLRG